MTSIASHASTPLSRLSLGACLALLAACPPETAQPTTTSATEDTSTGEPGTGTTMEPTTTGTTGPEPTTGPDTTGPDTTGPAPVCGNGMVEVGEACDDGNDVAEDGCNSACQPTAAIEWTRSLDFAKKSDAATDVAIDGAGRIIVAGWSSDAMGQSDQLILVLDPDGNEVWKQTWGGAAGLDDVLTAVEVDAQGQIFVGGREALTEDHFASVLRGVSPDGDLLWEFNEPNVETDFAQISQLVLADDAIYSIGTEEVGDKGALAVVRRHDPAMDGAAAWRTTTTGDTFYAVGESIALAGQELVVVGFAGEKFGDINPMIARFTTAGAVVSVDVEDAPDAIWYDIQPIGGAGDLLLAGRRIAGVTLPDATVRRITADGAQVWTDIYDQDFLYDAGFALAVGPDEGILLAGVSIKEGENDNALTRRLAGDGTVRWTSLHNNPEIDLYETASGAAIGPEFMVVAGRETVLGQSSNLWVRRYKLD